MRGKTGNINKITVSIIGVTVAMLISRILGMVREMVIASAYGAGIESDAIILALNIPLTLVGFIGSAVGDTYIPYFKSTEQKERQRVSNNLFWALAISGVGIAGLLSFFPQAVVKLFATGFAGEKLILTCRLIQYIIWTIIPIVLGKLLGAYLQLQQNFGIANVTGVLINLFAIVVIYFSQFKEDIVSILGVGVCAGYYIQLVFLLFAVSKRGWKFSYPQRNLGLGIGGYLQLGLPILFSSGVVEIQNIVDKNFASILSDGVMSDINYALKISGIIYSIMFSATTVLFPKMADINDEVQKPQLIKLLKKTISYMYLMVLPITVGCVILAELIVKILFERGSFTTGDTQVTASALQLYAVEFMVICISPLLVRAFYAMKDMRTPLVCSSISVTINITLNFFLIRKYQYKGLIFATVIADVCLCLLLLLFLKNKHGMGLIAKDLVWVAGVLAAIVMGIYVWWIYGILKVYVTDILSSIEILMGIVASGAVLYGMLLFMYLKVIERWR